MTCEPSTALDFPLHGSSCRVREEDKFQTTRYLWSKGSPRSYPRNSHRFASPRLQKSGCYAKKENISLISQHLFTTTGPFFFASSDLTEPSRKSRLWSRTNVISMSGSVASLQIVNSMTSIVGQACTSSFTITSKNGRVALY